MHKINYPDGKDLEELKNRYYKYLNPGGAETEIDKYLAKAGIKYNGVLLNFKTLVTLNFSTLINLKEGLKVYNDDVLLLKDENDKDYNPFSVLFDYSGCQQSIARFFMDENCFSLKACHYCGIEYINAFNYLHEYENALDFANRAPKEDFEKFVVRVGEERAKKIISKRPYKHIDEVQFNASIKDIFRPQNTHNHFTLDHVFPQAVYPFYSLCLFNLVPCCSSCNSKFKGSVEFDEADGDLNEMSPTSENYCFNDLFEFKLFYNAADVQVKTTDDFLILKQPTRPEQLKNINKYFLMFKLGGRYNYHKDVALRLVRQKLDYPDSRITELVGQTGLSELEIRKMVFGHELYDDTKSNLPFIKFKKDIAKNIQIKGVK